MLDRTRNDGGDALAPSKYRHREERSDPDFRAWIALSFRSAPFRAMTEQDKLSQQVFPSARHRDTYRVAYSLILSSDFSDHA